MCVFPSLFLTEVRGSDFVRNVKIISTAAHLDLLNQVRKEIVFLVQIHAFKTGCLNQKTVKPQKALNRCDQRELSVCFSLSVTNLSHSKFYLIFLSQSNFQFLRQTRTYFENFGSVTFLKKIET